MEGMGDGGDDWGGWGVIQNMYRCTQGGRGITPHVYVRTHSLSFFMLLSYGVLFYLEKFNLTFTQKGCVYQKWLFSPMR